jgi:hypothetical protein
MRLHRNAKLGLAGRYALVIAIEGGCSVREAARRHGVSPATACAWWRRWRVASDVERETRSCLFDRSSRPHSCPQTPVRSRQQCHKTPSHVKTWWPPQIFHFRYRGVSHACAFAG